uniref:Uncharacterized protein n=1 Tax=Parascaris univalens TaxID=6257 RepID=A0A915AXH4_PARUN
MANEMDDETSQLWILRHLRLLLNDIEDSILSSFILHQDCTQLRNFVNGYGKRRALYILVKRTHTSGATSTLLPHATGTDKEQKAWKAPAPATVKKAMGKKLTTTKRKKKVARNVNSTEVEPTKDEQVIAEKSANALQDETAPQVTLFWCETQVPTNSNEFVFIVTKTEASTNVGFDQLFHIGICNKGDMYWRLINLAIAIFGCEVDGYLKVDLLLLFCNAGFRWNDSSCKLKNFIIESIGLLYADCRKKEETDAISLPNMQTLLRPRIEAFSHSLLDTTERCRLLMELSLFDVDFIEHS